MNHRKNQSVFFVLFLILSGGCAPEIGSEAWCTQLQKQPKGDWTMNEASDYAKHCIFRPSEKSD